MLATDQLTSDADFCANTAKLVDPIGKAKMVGSFSAEWKLQYRLHSLRLRRVEFTLFKPDVPDSVPTSHEAAEILLKDACLVLESFNRCEFAEEFRNEQLAMLFSRARPVVDSNSLASQSVQ